jgi:hypothetical protein
MTFGRPCMMPNCIVKLDLPINQNLEKLTMLGGSAAGPSNLDPPDTVCFFTATMCAPAANSAFILHFANPVADNYTMSWETSFPSCTATTLTSMRAWPYQPSWKGLSSWNRN